MNQFSLNGFIKAAAQSNLSVDAILSALKTASDLTPQDIAQIRTSLMSQPKDKAPLPMYDDPSGSSYTQALLRARDTVGNKDPEQAAILAAAKHSIIGGAVGGVGGNMLGRILASHPSLTPDILKGVSHKFPRHLGVAGTVAGGLLAGIPAYVNTHHTISGLHKLNNPANMHQMIDATQSDRALLGS